jgi:hypothetical protein
MYACMCMYGCLPSCHEMLYTIDYRRTIQPKSHPTYVGLKSLLHDECDSSRFLQYRPAKMRQSVSNPCYLLENMKKRKNFQTGMDKEKHVVLDFMIKNEKSKGGCGKQKLDAGINSTDALAPMLSP